MNEFARPRERMIVEQLQNRGIHDARVLEAMRRVPREQFVDPELQDEAYADRPLPIGEGQTISQPLIVAFMIQSAAIAPGDRVLEIGAGAGYSAAVLGHVAQRVWTIERVPRLARFAGNRIAVLGMANVTVLRGDGTLGWPAAAPYDAILVAAAGPSVPETLRRQLVTGGRLVMPVGASSGAQRLIKVTRRGEDDFDEEDLCAVGFVPLVGEHGFADTAGPRGRRGES